MLNNFCSVRWKKWVSKRGGGNDRNTQFRVIVLKQFKINFFGVLFVMVIKMVALKFGKQVRMELIRQ